VKRENTWKRYSIITCEKFHSLVFLWQPYMHRCSDTHPLSTQISPLWASMISCKYRAKTVPRISGKRSICLENLWKSDDITFSAFLYQYRSRLYVPYLLSLYIAALTVILPPGGVNLMALSKRLMSTLWACPVSNNYQFGRRSFIRVISFFSAALSCHSSKM